MFVQVPGFPAYLVDENGVVVSTKYGKWRVLAARGNEYLEVAVYQDRRRINKKIHHIVAEVFIGPRPQGMVVNHKDTNKLNNAASNLEYVTPSQNTQHAYDNGVCEGVRKASRISNTGEHNPSAKLSDKDAAELLRLKGQMSQHKAGLLFGVSREHVRDIWLGRKRKHLTQGYI